MAAPKGNKYNEKWDLETSLQFCKDVLTYVKENENCSSLTMALTALGGYDELLVYIQNKFPEQDFKSIKESKDIIKSRLIDKGLNNKVNSTMAIFILKNNHDMADKVESKVDTNIQSVTLKDLVKFD